LFLKLAHGIDVEINLKKVDVYAYAMILYQVWTGIKPWEDIGDEDIERCVLSNQRPQFPKDFQNSQMKDLITTCWSNSSEDRLYFDQILK
jgi:hypothetical protein